MASQEQLTPEEEAQMAEFEAICRFRDMVLAGTHPRVQVPKEFRRNHPRFLEMQAASAMAPPQANTISPSLGATLQQSRSSQVASSPGEHKSSGDVVPVIPQFPPRRSVIVPIGVFAPAIDYKYKYFADIGATPYSDVNALQRGFAAKELHFSPVSQFGKPKWFSKRLELRQRTADTWYRAKKAYKILCDPDHRAKLQEVHGKKAMAEGQMDRSRRGSVDQQLAHLSLGQNVSIDYNHNYYADLKVQRKATVSRIEDVFETLWRSYSPASRIGQLKLQSAQFEIRRHATDRWYGIQKAYGILSDQKTREKYDRGYRGPGWEVTRLGREAIEREAREQEVVEMYERRRAMAIAIPEPASSEVARDAPSSSGLRPATRAQAQKPLPSFSDLTSWVPLQVATPTSAQVLKTSSLEGKFPSTASHAPSRSRTPTATKEEPSSPEDVNPSFANRDPGRGKTWARPWPGTQVSMPRKSK